MAGNVNGGKKTAAINRKKYGSDYYARLGALGGKKSRNGGFASNVVGADGLTGRQRASAAGAVGGRISKRKSGEG